jgi:hypothetical protein
MLPFFLQPRCFLHSSSIAELYIYIYIYIYTFFSLMGWDWVHSVLRLLFGLLYQPQMIDEDECGAVGGMRIDRRNRSTLRKPAQTPLCPPQIPHDLTRAWTRRLTAWAMVRTLTKCKYCTSDCATVKSGPPSGADKKPHDLLLTRKASLQCWKRYMKIVRIRNPSVSSDWRKVTTEHTITVVGS